jgi:hypothetical protein
LWESTFLQHCEPFRHSDDDAIVSVGQRGYPTLYLCSNSVVVQNNKCSNSYFY